jgi:hypothetical protein
MCSVVVSMMQGWCQQVRVGGRTSENSGELIGRKASKNFRCHFVKNVLTVKMY